MNKEKLRTYLKNGKEKLKKEWLSCSVQQDQEQSIICGEFVQIKKMLTKLDSGDFQ